MFCFIKYKNKHCFIKIKTNEVKCNTSLLFFLFNYKICIIGLYGSLMYVLLSGFADLWGISVIMLFFNVSKLDAASAFLTFYF